MRTLFIGNGINLLKTDGNSWSDVLQNLENKFVGIELTKDGVPFLGSVPGTKNENGEVASLRM